MQPLPEVYHLPLFLALPGLIWFAWRPSAAGGGGAAPRKTAMPWLFFPGLLQGPFSTSKCKKQQLPTSIPRKISLPLDGNSTINSH
jgi:hypothetical protein